MGWLRYSACLPGAYCVVQAMERHADIKRTGRWGVSSCASFLILHVLGHRALTYYTADGHKYFVHDQMDKSIAFRPNLDFLDLGKLILRSSVNHILSSFIK